MIVLALDTTGPACSAAIVDGARILARSQSHIRRGHAEFLAPQVQDLLRLAALTIADIDRIAVCTGPGSFTGLRVALALAKGLALPRNLPIVGISALEVCAAQADPDSKRSLLCYADVRRGEVFWQRFNYGKAVGSPVLSSFTELPESGDGVLEVGTVEPSLLGWLAMDRNPKTSPALPLYHRPPDAKLPGGKAYIPPQ